MTTFFLVYALALMMIGISLFWWISRKRQHQK